jgi:hypothetical protein
MRGFEPLNVAGIGARASTGANRVQVTLLARMKSAATGYVETASGRVFEVRPALGLPQATTGFERLVALAAPALREACATPWTDPRVLADAVAKRGAKDAVTSELLAPLPLLIALPAAGPARDDPRLDGPIVDVLAAASGVAIDRARSRVFRSGVRAFAEVLAAAFGHLAERHAVLVGGVDALTDPLRLQAIDDAEGTRRRRRAPPAEAASFLLLARGRPSHSAHPLRALARLISAEAREPAAPPPAPAEPSPAPGADAWIAAIRASTELLSGVGVSWVLTDVDGTRARREAWGDVAAQALGEDVHVEHPIETVGDIGATTGALLAAIACTSWEIGCARAPTALVTWSDDPFAAPDAAGAMPPASFGSAAALFEVGDAPMFPESAEPRGPPLPRVIAFARSALELVRAIPPSDAGRGTCRDLDAAWGALGELVGLAPSDARQVDLLMSSVDHLTSARRAIEETIGSKYARAAAELQAISSSLEDARPALLDRIVVATARPEPATPPSPRSPPPPIRASVGVPRLHAAAPRGLRPFTELYLRRFADEPDEPIDEAAIAPTRAGKDETSPTDEAAAQVRAPFVTLALEAMREIGRLSWMRRPVAGQPWRLGFAEFEERILHALDALVSLGVAAGDEPALDVAAEVLRYANESLSDPARAFVRTFVLGCLEGEDGLRAARMAMRASNPVTLTAHLDGLALAANPAARAIAEELLLDPDARLVELGLDVLRARGTVDVALVAPALAHPSAGVQERAALALALAAPAEREVVIALVEPLLGEAAEESAKRGALEALILLDARSSLDFARAELGAMARRRADHGDLLLFLIRLLAIAGASGDGELLLRAARAPAPLSELGWLGQVTMIDVLIRALEGRLDIAELEDGGRASLGYALQRITGAHVDAAGVPLRGAIPVGALVDARAWRRFWTTRGSEFSTGQRYRWGKPFTLEATLDEMSTDGTDPATRDACALELGAVVGPTRVPWLGGWTPTQLERLAALREHLRSREGRRLHEPGQWIAAQVGRRRA